MVVRLLTDRFHCNNINLLITSSIHAAHGEPLPLRKIACFHTANGCYLVIKRICNKSNDTLCVNCEGLTLDSLFQSQSPQVILVVPSSQMLTPISDKKAKILLGMGATQLALGILEIVLNIGASIMWAHVAYFVGPGYWCGIFVSYVSFSHQGDVICESNNWQLDCLFQQRE